MAPPFSSDGLKIPYWEVLVVEIQFTDYSCYLPTCYCVFKLMLFNGN